MSEEITEVPVAPSELTTPVQSTLSTTPPSASPANAPGLDQQPSINNVLMSLTDKCLKAGLFKDIAETAPIYQYLQLLKQNKVHDDMTKHFQILADRAISEGLVKSLEESHLYFMALSIISKKLKESKKSKQ